MRAHYGQSVVVQTGRSLSELTTLRAGGPAQELVEAHTSDDVIEAVRSTDLPVLIVAGGSNLLVGDQGFAGRVVVIKTDGVIIRRDGMIDVQAGTPWDSVVEQTLAEKLSGFETLSGIPGSTGAAPVQNIGAYGEEIATTFVSLSAYDRQQSKVVDFARADCGFGYRTSVFKRNDRYVILSVRFALQPSQHSVPIAYAELARALGIAEGERAPVADVRRAVLVLRKSKGMVLDASDTDTHSAGSFFTNPIVPREMLVADAPHWELSDGSVKLSAGWLIRNAGFDPGFQLGNARLSTKHALAITNAGGATAAEIAQLARTVRDGVRERFGIELHPEPVLSGIEI